MPRQVRFEDDGAFYHVMARGGMVGGDRQEILTNCNGETEASKAAACLYWPDDQLAVKRILTTENAENDIQKVSNLPATPSALNHQPPKPISGMAWRSCVAAIPSTSTNHTRAEDR